MADRARAGNGMARAREALIVGALRAISEHGVKRTTMNLISDISKTARGTLYNHFRNKAELLRAVTEYEVERIGTLGINAATKRDPDAGLKVVLTEISNHPVLAYLREHEPEALIPLIMVQDNEQWHRVFELAKEIGKFGEERSEEIVRKCIGAILNPVRSSETLF